jgi:hypothetical protein
MLTPALDIGGSKIAAGLVDPVGVLVHAAIQPIPKNQDAERVWAGWTSFAACVSCRLRSAATPV